MEIFCSYQSADFNENYSCYDGEYSRDLVDGGLLLEKDEAQESPDDYRSFPDRGHIAGLGLGEKVVDQKDYGIADEAAVAYDAGIFPFAPEGVPHMAEGVTAQEHQRDDGKTHGHNSP